MRRTSVALALLAAALPAYGAARDDIAAALRGITAPELRAHIRFLSHDLLEGRAPGTRGGRTAALYIATQFARSGLQPVRGSYLQPVPLVGTTADPRRVAVEFVAGGRPVPAAYPANVVVWPGEPDTAAAAAGELVFVGYGVRAPEYRWDDFKGRDLRGKVLLILVNDPPAPPEEPALFDGRGMSYYGRWTYKLEEAARHGAAGVLLVHSPDGAGYAWPVVQSSWTGELLSLPRDANEPAAVPVAGWITDAFARRLLAAAGLRLDELYVAAARRDFRPVSTGIAVRARVPGRVRRIETANVVGLVPGNDPQRRDEVVVLTSHYDHLGIGPAVEGDSIYNGAYDNASGVALLLEVAEAFARLEPAPDRSILFIATAAEEAGLLGSTHYTRHPLFPLDRTVAAINVDGANLWGETDDVAAIGADRSTLGEVLAARAAEMGLELLGDRAPERGFFFRSDHFPFARAGVPALYLEHGLDFRGRPSGWGLETLERYDLLHYHQPSDELPADADLSGAVQQARLAFLIAHDVARAARRPAWYPPFEPRAGRERASSRAR